MSTYGEQKPQTSGTSASVQRKSINQDAVPNNVSGVKEESTAKGAVNKIYACKYCKKPFVSKWKVDRHQRKHTNERPFSCPTCPSKFRDNSSLLNHQRRFQHHNWDVKCPHCSKPFATEKSLRRHNVYACQQYYELFMKRGF